MPTNPRPILSVIHGFKFNTIIMKTKIQKMLCDGPWITKRHRRAGASACQEKPPSPGANPGFISAAYMILKIHHGIKVMIPVKNRATLPHFSFLKPSEVQDILV